MAITAEHDGLLTVVALGPLTNIALALKLDPLLPSRLKRLVIMGSGGENVSEFLGIQSLKLFLLERVARHVWMDM
eukprot:742144-Pelagomonas_calceolata.AAC.2